MLDHDALQALLNKYPDFVWMGDHGRREKGQERFLLGRVVELELTDEKDIAIFTIRTRPQHLVWKLRDWLIHRVGEAVCFPGRHDDYDIDGMILDVGALAD